MKKINSIFYSILIIWGLTGMGYFIFSLHKENKEYYSTKNNGIIMNIEYYEGNGGLPEVKVNNKLYLLGRNYEKIFHYIRVGDSIAKDSGSVIIKIYRKDEKNEWKVKVFKQ